MKKQIDLIRKDGFPSNYGLFENNIIFREHHDRDVIKIMNDWWRWVENYSRRDQLSLTYVLWKNNFQVSPLSDIPLPEQQKNFSVAKPESCYRRRINPAGKIFSELF